MKKQNRLNNVKKYDPNSEEFIHFVINNKFFKRQFQQKKTSKMYLVHSNNFKINLNRHYILIEPLIIEIFYTNYIEIGINRRRVITHVRLCLN